MVNILTWFRNEAAALRSVSPARRPSADATQAHAEARVTDGMAASIPHSASSQNVRPGPSLAAPSQQPRHAGHVADLQQVRGSLRSVPALTPKSLDAWVKSTSMWSDQREARKTVAKTIRDHSTVDASGSYVTPNLAINFVRDLDSLPPGLRVTGKLSLHNTPVTSLPSGLQAGRLDVHNCSNLRMIPEGLHIAGDVSLKNNDRLERWPRQMHIGGKLDLSMCTKLQSLPGDHQVSGNIHVGHGQRIISVGTLRYREVRQAENGRTFVADHARSQRTALSDPSNPNRLTWDNLPARAIIDGELNDRDCPFSLEPLSTLQDAVFWRRQGGTLAGAKFDDFMRWWGGKGTDPETRLVIDAKDLFRRE